MFFMWFKFKIRFCYHNFGYVGTKGLLINYKKVVPIIIICKRKISFFLFSNIYYEWEVIGLKRYDRVRINKMLTLSFKYLNVFVIKKPWFIGNGIFYFN